MGMKTFSLIIGIALFFISAKSSENYKCELLIGEWYLFETTVQGGEETCHASEGVINDNSYIFLADGTFEFRHGVVTEDTQCDDCCHDMVDIVGEWEYNETESTISVTALHEKANAANSMYATLYNGKLQIVEETRFVLVQMNTETGMRYTLEFRKR